MIKKLLWEHQSWCCATSFVSIEDSIYIKSWSFENCSSDHHQLHFVSIAIKDSVYSESEPLGNRCDNHRQLPLQPSAKIAEMAKNGLNDLQRDGKMSIDVVYTLPRSPFPTKSEAGHICCSSPLIFGGSGQEGRYLADWSVSAPPSFWSPTKVRRANVTENQSEDHKWSASPMLVHQFLRSCDFRTYLATIATQELITWGCDISFLFIDRDSTYLLRNKAAKQNGLDK